MGLITFHGPMAEEEPGAEAEYNRAGMLRAVSERGALGTLPVPPGQPAPRTLCPGRARGRLLGGNLSLLAASLGTPWALDAAGALLLLEDAHEPPYRLDRYLTQLLLAGTLQAASGFVVGEFVDCKATAGGPTAEEVVAERLRSLGKPAAYGFCLGHGRYRLTVPLGALAELDADRAVLTILEEAAVGSA